MKVIEIEDSGFVWNIPLRVIADARAKYYAARDSDTTYQDEFNYVMEDDYEGLDWFQNNMNFEDVESEAVLVTKPQPLKRPRPAHWECTLIEAPEVTP